jgi:hypothetical protein
MTARALHRWVGLVVGLQLLAWIIGGFYFSFVPIDEVRGRWMVEQPGPVPITAPVQLPPVLASGQCTGARLHTDLPRAPGRPVWVLDCEDATRIVDGGSGEVLGALDAQRIRSLAARLSGLEALDASLLEKAPPGAEFRGAPLPLWQVSLEHPEAPRLYLSLETGEIHAVRTDTWRLFDLLWGLHIMDWDDRDDFNHLLLQGAALLALVSTGSGLWLAFAHYRRRLRRRRSVQPSR